MTVPARWLRRYGGAAVLVLALAAAACSAEDELEGGRESEASAANPASPSSVEVDEAPSAETDPEIDGPADSIDDLEARWADARLETIELVRSAGYGIDDGVLTGPGEFSFDLTDCPDDWSDTAGIGDGAITVAQILAQSGALSQFADWGLGFQVYLDYVNSNGGLDGRALDLRLENDRFVSAVTAELATALVASGEVFSVSTVGFPGTAEVRSWLNQSCVPQPFVGSDHPAWGDPENLPWTSGYQLSFRSEALLWGAWIEQNLAADLPVSVGALVADDDLGVIYQQAFQEWADAHPEVVAEFAAVAHPAGAPSVGAEMAQVAAAQPDVVLAMTQGQSCVSAMAESAALGLAESALAQFAPSVCGDPQAFMLPSGGAAEGWWVVDGGFKSTSDPANADDPWVAWVNEQLEANGYATSNELYSAGFAHGWALVEALRIAAELDGGLTRSNFLLALRSMSLPNPNLVDGVVFEVDGNNDAFFVEGSQFSQWDATAGEWVQRGDVIDLNGQTGTCEWEPGAGC